MSIILVFITLSIPIITQILIDTGFNGPLSFFIIIASLSISAAISTILSFARSIFSIKMVYKFSWYLMDNAFRRLLFLPAKYFTVRSPGEIIYRLNALTRIQDVLGSVLVQAILDFISGTALLIYVFWVSPTVGFITLVILTINFIFLVISQKYINAAKDKELHEGSEAQSIQLDALVSINSVKLGGYTETYIKDWESKYQKLLNAMTFRMKLQDGLVRSVLSSTQTFAPVFILAINLYLVKLEIMTLGQAIAIQAIVSLLFSYTNSIFSTISETLMSLKYIELADDIFEYPTEEYSKSSSHLLKSGNISLQNITFSYTPDSSAAIKDVNLDIYEEETVALVGVSGSGKTTLGKIISTLFKPSDGLLYYDDIEDNKYNINILRESISYIPQEANLHNRTIMENLKLGCNNTEIEIKTFCDNLGFLDFINELPMGYNTVVSEMGANLSGGQRQRIHIAKVLLQNPKILVMDEATSSLDNISQSKVYEALDNLQCTKVVIAHRLDTVLNANRIIVLDKGEIVETGTHLELISKRGLYYYLFNTNIKEEF
ncbi:ATP-binding cassette domain-containing protein [Staphylococcus equorum]|uniref:ATP-binding cassette domain-containing protein n=1 Tax=Staphylococcus equorum TaxID=246432 RepID=A0A9X4QYS9_9STAP|nr:ATP-binding cassette domain-containing protein [Staphylococcus equorum]MDG0819671.1 ATP-binding cassette domain-containing protein [Staphylococcus equorum]MDG0840312.1 ATP-binding cassette domain-containing protein [Staphylococcus equorum]MDG0845995.1 ATP-binding cassette domain-containing protein [Staphylococcus equorum]